MNGKACFCPSAMNVPIERIAAVIGGAHRFEVVQSLIGGWRDVTSIADELELGLGTISQTLAIMRNYELVEKRVEGARRLYRLGARVQATQDDAYTHLRIIGRAAEYFEMQRQIAP